MKKKLYVVIGNGKCGKSSLVRSLTGLYKYSVVRIERLTPNDKIDLMVWIRSLQEYGYSPEEVLAYVLEYEEDYLLLTVRIHPHYHLPDVFGYLDVLVPHYDIEGIAVISEEPIDSGLYNKIEQYCPINTHKFEESLSTPINVTSTAVKRAWKWA